MADEITLKEFIERIFAEREKQLQLHFINSENALILSKLELDKRLNELNNLRTEYTKDRMNDNHFFLRQETYYDKMTSLDKDIKDLQLSKASLEGKASQQSVTRVTIIALAGLFISLIGILIAISNFFYKK
jgi:poly-D-alanine transfer protein DltD